ncbi:MAG: oligosaccharide flippase family protein [Taibaiella sp.]|nr:oligosaccharide flippase family protein [Taibaiella sp.]
MLKAGSSAFYSNSFLIFIIRFFPSLANLLVISWYAKMLPQSVYGDYSHFWIQLSVFYPLICFGIHMLAITYPPALLSRLVNALLKRHFVLFGIWAVAIGSAFAALQWLKTGIPFIIPFCFIICYAFTFILESFLIVYSSFKTLIVTNVIYSAAYWLVHLYVLKNSFSLVALFAYLLVVVIVRMLVYLFVAFRSHSSFPVAGNRETVEKLNIKTLWLHLALYDVVQNASVWIDKFIISLVLSSGMSAIYYNGAQNVPFLPLILSAAASAALMQMAGVQHQESENIRALMNKTGKVLSCIVFPVFFCLFFYRQEVIIGLFSVKYVAAVPVFMVSLLVLPVRAYSFTTVLQRMHKGAVITAGAIGEIVLALLLMYPLYRLAGLPGVALSFVISTYLQAAYYIVKTASLLHVPVWAILPLKNWLIKFTVTGIIIWIVHYACSEYPWWLSLGMGAASMTVIILSMLYYEICYTGGRGKA